MTMRLVKAIMATMMNVVLCARSILPFYASTGFSPLRLLAALSLTAVSLSLTLYPTASYAVFTTPGQFSVGGDGAATYNIPIQVPPGTDGLKSGLVTSLASFTYKSTVGQMANPSPGVGLSNANDTSMQPDGMYKVIKGLLIRNIPSDVLENNYNIIGLNEIPLVYNSDGTLAFWANLSKQGGFISSVMNAIPGINATAALHDTWWNPGKFMGLGFNGATNWGTMLPAAVITYGAMAGSPYLGNSVRVDRLFR